MGQPAGADEVYYLCDAIKRAGSTEPDKLVDAVEKTNWEGTVGRIQFFGKDDPSTHGIKYGEQYVSGLLVQWQDGKQVPVWPKAVSGGNELRFPTFVKLTN